MQRANSSLQWHGALTGITEARRSYHWAALPPNAFARHLGQSRKYKKDFSISGSTTLREAQRIATMSVAEAYRIIKTTRVFGVHESQKLSGITALPLLPWVYLLWLKRYKREWIGLTSPGITTSTNYLCYIRERSLEALIINSTATHNQQPTDIWKSRCSSSTSTLSCCWPLPPCSPSQPTLANA